MSKPRIMKEVTEWIPLIYVPIPGRHNPVFVVPTTNTAVVEAEILPEDEEGIEIAGNVTDDLINAVAAFYNFIRKKVGANIKIRIAAYATGPINDAFLYVAMTNAMLEVLGGPLDKEILSATSIIDSQLGADEAIVALRQYILHDRPYVWRRGETSIEADERTSIEATIVEEHDMNFIEPIMPDLITHIAGMTVIEAFRNFPRDIEELRKAVRANNALWHFIYGVPLPKDEERLQVVVKGLGHALLTEVEILGGGRD